MRPRRADTSEPACVKRKMLSTNRRTSWPCSSRKYSATVSADSATRARAPGGLVDDARLAVAEERLRHLDLEVGAFARALTDAGEAAHAAVRLRDVVDE